VINPLNNPHKIGWMSWIIHPVEGDLNFHSEEKRVLLNKINPSTAGLPYPQKKKSVTWKRGRGETATDTEMTTGDEAGGGGRRLGAFVRQPSAARCVRPAAVEWNGE
jgi:hypothetical protein